MIIDIPDDEYNYFMYSEDFDSDDGYDAIEFICNGIVLDNVTNGAVIKALFPDGKVIEREDGDIEYDLIFSKHIDGLTCGEVKEAIEMCKVDIFDKIRAEIIKYEADCRLSVDEYPSCKQCTDNVFESIYAILDKYKAESEKTI